MIFHEYIKRFHQVQGSSIVLTIIISMTDLALRDGIH